MKFRTRVLLAVGVLRFGGTAGLIVVSFYLYPILLLASLAWLCWSRRIIRRWLLPPLFPYVTCPSAQCRKRIALRQRWSSMSGHWTDSRVRHALSVYSDRGYEMRGFDCPSCGTTISLQKGDRQLYKRWKPVDVVASSKGTNRAEQGLWIGVDRTDAPGLLARWWRRLRGRPRQRPVVLTNDVISRHGTVFGATGMGKSTLIINLAAQVFRNGDGATFLDPAGDLSRDLLRHVPKDRVDDVIYIDVSDQAFPFPFNILRAQSTNERNLLVDEVLGIFKHLYERSWGDTLSHQLRMALNAVLEVDGSFQDVYDLFTNATARRHLVCKLKNRELRNYWEETFPGSSATARMSVINKLAPIVKHPFLGPMLCSAGCGFDADEVIRGRKILIVNLATGTRADYTASILGTFIVNKIVSAAYRQGKIEDRTKRVRHFFFVDEFQTLMHRGSGWDRSLSELRKFNLHLLLFTQFIEQVKEDIRAAIFGNVGFLVAFRVGHRDSKLLRDEFEGCSKQDLLELERGECLVRVGTHAMSVRTQLIPEPSYDLTPVIIERMHAMIAKLRAGEPTYRTNIADDSEVDEKSEQTFADSWDVEPASIELCEYA